MDSFYSTMLVHSTDVELITKKWAQLAKQDGFKIADHESDGLEALAIFSMDAPWTTILLTEGCPADPEQLSKLLKTSVVDLSVHDGDIWVYAWFRDGEFVDRHSSVNLHEYFGVDTSLFDDDDYDFSEEEKDNGLSKLTLDQRWKALKNEIPSDRETFDAVLSPDATTAGEEGLEKFLELLGLPCEIAYMPYDSWSEEQNTEELVLERQLYFQD